jgi:hypothetical protein
MIPDPITPLVNLTKKALEEHTTAAALRTHLEFLLSQYEPARNSIRELQQENSRLEELCRTMGEELARKAKSNAFVEYRGAKFKCVGGKIDRLTVYCPRCETSADTFIPDRFSCGCGWSWDVHPERLAESLKDLVD